MTQEETLKRWHKWTSAEHRFLLKHYRTIGDTKLAEMFNHEFPKSYPWTKKHIEKRRKYFGLKRSRQEESHLRVLNNGDGRHKRMWVTRGAAKDGDIKTWKGREYIKIDGKFVDYYRHTTKAKPGEIVRHHEGELKIIDRKENQRLNASIRANRPTELKETIKVLNKLKTLLYGKEDRRSQGNTI